VSKHGRNTAYRLKREDAGAAPAASTIYPGRKWRTVTPSPERRRCRFDSGLCQEATASRGSCWGRTSIDCAERRGARPGMAHRDGTVSRNANDNLPVTAMEMAEAA